MAERRDLAVVHIRAPLIVAQRQQVEADLLDPFRRDRAQHAALFDHVEIMLDSFDLTGAGDVVIGIVELPRVAQRVPVLHGDLAAALVVQLVIRVPQRAVMEIRLRREVERALLVTRRRAVLTETLGQMLVGLPLLLERCCFDIDMHGLVSWDGLRRKFKSSDRAAPRVSRPRYPPVYAAIRHVRGRSARILRG